MSQDAFRRNLKLRYSAIGIEITKWASAASNYLIAGNRLRVEREDETSMKKELPIDDPRVRFFASKVGVLADKEREAVKSIIEA
jgi:hypothetical protein